jgi:hypothetical protein
MRLHRAIEPPSGFIPRGEARWSGSRHAVVSGLLLLVMVLSSCRTRPKPSAVLPIEPGLSYFSQSRTKPPVSIHAVRLDRSARQFELHSVHALGGALGVSSVSGLSESLGREWGTPVAAVNGDFFLLKGVPYAGDPRGLQIVEGELISAPSGRACFWMGEDGQPHATNVTAEFRVVWPDGSATPVGLNERRSTNGVVLYTPTLGKSTLTGGGYELVLERVGESPWLPLRVGECLTARVRQLRYHGDARLDPKTMILSVDPVQTNCPPQVGPGAVLHIFLATSPGLSGTKMALGGGPVLVRGGQRLALPRPIVKGPWPYEFVAMRERHPRTALGWNERYYFLVVVDGRQKRLSRGMTLPELADYMISLGCQEAVNLDGGGSSTLWCNGVVLNSPSDVWEREVANALVVVRKDKPPAPAVVPGLLAH